jgi:hypothetical protein
MLVRDKHIFSSETMLHRDFDRKGSVEQKKKKNPPVVILKGLVTEAKVTLTQSLT